MNKEDIQPSISNPYFSTENVVNDLTLSLKFLVLDDSDPEEIRTL